MTTKSKRGVVGYLMFDKIMVENANALSGNLVYGVPAVTGIKGAFHAMSRKIMVGKDTADMKVALRGVLIACHKHKLLASRSESYKNYRFMQQKTSVVAKGDFVKQSGGVSPSIIEQAYCSFTMSFVVEVVCDRYLTAQDKVVLASEAYKIIQHNRIAGGAVAPFKDKSKVSFIELDDLNDLSYRLANSSILVDATDSLIDLLDENQDLTAIDVLLEVAGVNWTPVMPAIESENSVKSVEWVKSRLGSKYGWLVPITNGYQSISRTFLAGEMENSRASDTKEVESSYVEAVYTLGRWVNPHTLRLNDDMRNAFWCYDYQPENSLYLVKTNPITKKGSHQNV